MGNNPSKGNVEFHPDLWIFEMGPHDWAPFRDILSSVHDVMRIGISSSAFLLTASLILFPIGGIVWGYCMWIFVEKAYWENKASELALESDRSRNE